MNAAGKPRPSGPHGAPAPPPEPQRTGPAIRAVLRRVPWPVAVGGWLLAYGAGLALGMLLQLAGWWRNGSAWERALLTLAHRTVDAALDPLFLWVPLIGTNYTLVPIIAIAVVVIWRRGYHVTAVHLATVQLGSWMVNPALKFTIPRPRPDLFELRGQYALPAYPSGHSIAVVSVLFTVAYLVDRAGHGTWAYWAVAAFFLVNSYSRIYLAVHWPTDVVGGVLVGAVWLATTLLVFRPLHDEYARRRGRHGPPAD